MQEILNHGFLPVSTTDIPGLSGKLHLYCHLKTGAELCWLERDCDNKTFCISFQTLPEDDTGVFHILEHSVLCGSEKYPVKEPFVELLKGSLNTFLNAMTFPDKTVYPVSSRNDTDFRNLMHIYLDAVFCPNIYHNPNIFRQEGWHYELDENGDPHYVGVVFGEMKGAFSSVDQIIYTKLNQMLFPDSSYRFCSGGDPVHIPDLSYEQFIESHRRFYHPSNAKIFLDGKMDINRILCDIDETYLCKYSRREPDFSIACQNAIPYSQQMAYYEISPQEDKTGKAHFVSGKVIASWKDIEKILAIQILSDYLSGSNNAPVTRKVLSQGLGQDFGIAIDDSIAQPYLMMQVRNCSEEKLPTMKEEIQSIIRSVLAEGLDKQELIAALNRLEFQNKERNEPVGVSLALDVGKSWMYGGDPASYLDLSSVFTVLREKIESTYYTDLLKEVFLNDDGMAVLYVLPSDTLGQEKMEQEQNRLSSSAASWSADEKETVIRTQQELSAWQQTPDSAEAAASIPHLAVTDLPLLPLWTGCEEETHGNVRILRTKNATAGTSFLNLYFALPELSIQQLSVISFLSELLGKLPTRRHSGEVIQREMKTWLGDLNFSVKPIGRNDDPDHVVCYLHVQCSMLEDNAAHAVSLIREILLETILDQKDSIVEILQQAYLSAQQNLIMSGHQYAFLHALSGMSAENAAAEAISGFGYYQYLKAAVESFDYDGTLAIMKSVMEKITDFSITVGITGNVPEEMLNSLIDGFGGGIQTATFTLTEHTVCRDAISIPAGISYAVRAGNFLSLEEVYHGSYALAAKILSLSYLWNEVRVQGGAYGAGMGVRANGDVFCYSFRDPNPARSMEIYRKAAEYLRHFVENKESFEPFIIGVVSDSEPLLSAGEEGKTAVERCLRGVTLEDKKREREELLQATCENLLSFCNILDRMQESICVVGNTGLQEEGLLHISC